MDKPLTLIIYKHSVDPRFTGKLREMFEGSYSSGWLSNNLDKPFIIQWGNSKDRDTAKCLMKDVLKKQGDRQVLFYDNEIPFRKSGSSIMELPQEVYQDIISKSEVWNKLNLA